jgi:hypothetical protein
MGGLHWFLVVGKIVQDGETSYRVANFDRRATQRLVSAVTIRNGMRLAAKRSGYPRALLLRTPGKGMPGLGWTGIYLKRISPKPRRARWEV